MHIMEGSDAPSPTSIERNGSDWQMTLKEVNASTENITTGITSHSFDGNSVSFQGVIAAPTPCHSLNAEIGSDEMDSYTYSVSTKKDSNNTCQQVISYREYNATFETDRPFKLTVKHGNSTTETLKHPDFGREGEVVDMPTIQPERKGPIEKLIDWVKGLFSSDPQRISADRSRSENLDGEDIVVEEG